MTASNDARSLGEELTGDDATNLKQRIQDRTREIVDHGKEAVRDMGSRVRGQVCDRPLTSLVAAGGIGLLLGLLLGRKR